MSKIVIGLKLAGADSRLALGDDLTCFIADLANASFRTGDALNAPILMPRSEAFAGRMLGVLTSRKPATAAVPVGGRREQGVGGAPAA